MKPKQINIRRKSKPKQVKEYPEHVKDILDYYNKTGVVNISEQYELMKHGFIEV